MTPGPKAKFGALLLVVSFVFFSALLYGGAKLVEEGPAAAEESGDEGPTTPGGPVSVTVVAKALAFDKRTINASPGARVTVILDNQDAGVLHNIAFYTNRSASQVIFRGVTFPGIAQRTESFDSPNSPGSYFFRCDVHPDTMTGTFAVR